MPHLVGGTWTIAHENPVRSHGGGADAYPQAIASRAGKLWVAGRYRSGNHGFLALVEGPGASGQLHQRSTPNPTPQDNYLWRIAPVGDGQHVWAVGTYDGQSGMRTLIMHYAGGKP